MRELAKTDLHNINSSFCCLYCIGIMARFNLD
jgi:hypothetical protein